MRNLQFVFLIILSFCNKFQEQHLVGNWAVFAPNDYNEFCFIENSQIETIDQWGFKRAGEYNLANGELRVEFESGLKWKAKIKSITQDSMVLFDDRLL